MFVFNTDLQVLDLITYGIRINHIGLFNHLCYGKCQGGARTYKHRKAQTSPQRDWRGNVTGELCA